MPAIATPSTSDLLDEIRRLARDFPLPHPRWHRHVPLMHAVVDDLTASIDAIAGSPAALASLEAVVAEDAAADAAPRSPALAAAWARLNELPVPEGEHPYPDDIRLALEAARTTLAALARVPDGEALFGAASAGLADSPP